MRYIEVKVDEMKSDSNSAIRKAYLAFEGNIGTGLYRRDEVVST